MGEQNTECSLSNLYSVFNRRTELPTWEALSKALAKTIPIGTWQKTIKVVLPNMHRFRSWREKNGEVFPQKPTSSQEEWHHRHTEAVATQGKSAAGRGAGLCPAMGPGRRIKKWNQLQLTCHASISHHISISLSWSRWKSTHFSLKNVTPNDKEE